MQSMEVVSPASTDFTSSDDSKKISTTFTNDKCVFRMLNVIINTVSGVQLVSELST